MAGTWSDIGRESRRAWAVQRVARSVAWELLSQPKPKDFARVPPGPAALTPEWLTEVLCRGRSGCRVTAITLGAASSGSGDRCAFSVTYNEAGRKAGLPTQLFHKGVDQFYTRLHLLRLQIIENEPRFYAQIRPTLAFEAPCAYFAALEPRTYRVAIILDDVIQQKGAEFFEVATKIERSDVDQMTAILAELHARYWTSPALDGFPWLHDPVSYTDLLIEGMELEQLTVNGIERAAAVLPRDMTRRKDLIWRAFRAAMALSREGPATFLHGDPHLRNFYKTREGTVGLADWQVTLRGAWSHDFTYCLLTSLPVAQRRAWEKDLLQNYLTRVKAGGANPPSHADAWERYRRQTLYTLVGWLATIGFGALQPSMQPDSESLEIIRRAAAAVEDLGSLQLLTGQNG